MRTLPVVFAAALSLSLALASGPARANDSSAALTTGGLELRQNAVVEMDSEDLFVSAKEIRVRYRFVNPTQQAVTTLVAFPMPDVTVSGPDENISVPTEEPENLLAFRTLVNGAPVAARVEQKALAKGVDRTALLRELGAPLAPHLRATGEALDRLPPPAKDQLLKLGLAEIEEFDAGKGWEKHLSPRWTLKTTWFWEQTFAPGETLIEHAYKPSVGGSAGTSFGAKDWRNDKSAAEAARRYCVDQDFLASIERVRRAARADYPPLSEERISYVLSSGANWAKPIRDFRLVVDKGAPDRLISLCAEGVRKISPTQFEWRRRDFRPAGDLHVLILKKQGAE